MRLSEQQINYFHTFGFLQFPGLLADRADAIIDAFETIWTGRGGGHNGRPHDGLRQSSIVPFIDQHEYLASLLDDPRIEGIASSLLGDDFNYFTSDGNYYVGDTQWHSDVGTDPGRWTSDHLSLKMARTATPGRRRHLEQFWANDGHLAELSRQKRLEMPEPSRN